MNSGGRLEACNYTAAQVSKETFPRQETKNSAFPSPPKGQESYLSLIQTTSTETLSHMGEATFNFVSVSIVDNDATRIPILLGISFPGLPYKALQTGWLK